MSSLRERLLSMLDEKGISQHDLARELHVTRSAVAFWIKNDSIPTRSLVRIAHLLDVSLDWLLHGAGPSRLSAFQARSSHITHQQRVLLESLRLSGDNIADTFMDLFKNFLKPAYGDNPVEGLEFANFSKQAKTALFDASGRVLEMSNTMLDFLEVEKENKLEVIGSSIFSWIQADELPEMVKRFSEWKNEGYAKRKGVTDFCLKTKTGKTTGKVTVHYVSIANADSQSAERIFCVIL